MDKLEILYREKLDTFFNTDVVAKFKNINKHQGVKCIDITPKMLKDSAKFKLAVEVGKTLPRPKD